MAVEHDSKASRGADWTQRCIFLVSNIIIFRGAKTYHFLFGSEKQIHSNWRWPNTSRRLQETTLSTGRLRGLTKTAHCSLSLCPKQPNCENEPSIYFSFSKCGNGMNAQVLLFFVWECADAVIHIWVKIQCPQWRILAYFWRMGWAWAILSLGPIWEISKYFGTLFVQRNISGLFNYFWEYGFLVGNFKSMVWLCICIY